MKKTALLIVFGIFLLLAISGFASASYANYDNGYPSCYDCNYPSYSSQSSSYPSTYTAYPTYSSNSNSGSNYQNFNQNPVYTVKDFSTTKKVNTNFDSTNYASTYQGPVYQADVRYNEYLNVKKSGKVIQTISYADNSRYLGASQTVNANTQNRQTSEFDNTNSYVKEYDGGFSWSQRDSFARANTNYDWYYQPVYSNGYYNWDW